MPTVHGAYRRLRRSLRPLKRALRGTPPPPSDPPADEATEGEPPAPPPPPWWEEPASPWRSYNVSEANATAFCPICRWRGVAFDGGAHAEFATCEGCGSVARDRFLFWCFVRRTPASLGATVLETSPRMGDEYRRAMASWFDYTASDFDEHAHKGAVKLDLQDIDLPDGSVDVLLTPHVLEHVPDTDAALDEVRRVLAPGGRMYLQVPILQGTTAPPTEPEFHGDDTPVHWRFGFDLTARLREHGFETTLLATQPWIDVVEGGEGTWPGHVSEEFDVASMLEGAIAEDLTSVADRVWAERIGATPGFMFLTWECVNPA